MRHRGFLNFYPLLNSVLSSSFKALLIKHHPRNTSLDANMNTYSSFIDILNLSDDHVSDYAGLDILNSAQRIEQQFRIFVGFVYSNHSFSGSTKYNICHSFKKIFTGIACENNSKLSSFKLTSSRKTDDVLDCIELYKNVRINEQKRSYYQGWMAKDKEENIHYLHLAPVYDNYGNKFTDELHNAFSNYLRKHRGKTAINIVSRLVGLWKSIVELYPTYKGMQEALSEKQMSKTFEEILNLKIARKLQKNQDVKSYLNVRWGVTVLFFNQCFIEPNGLFCEPLRPIILPRFKTQKKSKASVSTGNKLSRTSKERLFTNIPLSINDDQVIELITNRINRDIEHVRIVAQIFIDQTKERHKRNKELLKKGKIKPIEAGLGTSFQIGPEHLANTIATFYRYGFSIRDYYTYFLGFNGHQKALIRELNLPTRGTVIPFLIQLVIEHPKITPQWFLEWELFDKNGNQIGFKQAGDQYVAVSFKNRRGATNAQQEVVLSEHSKQIVEALIEHTAFARDALKKKGGSDWRYMLITADGVTNSLNRIKKNITSKRSVSLAPFLDALAQESRNENGEVILTQKQASALAPTVDLRPTRATRAVQIYLETHSTRAMSEALGHKNYEPKLLDSYLPEPLLEFFNGRWIRIFQNAIIYEAMKDSDYLFDAVDFTEDELDEFLLNHQLGELPEHIKNGKKQASSSEKKLDEEFKFDELRIALSTPILQVLIAISNIVEQAKEEEVIPQVLSKWYETAIFIIHHLTLCREEKTKSSGMRDVLSLYDNALSNSLDIKVFKENLQCR